MSRRSAVESSSSGGRISIPRIMKFFACGCYALAGLLGAIYTQLPFMTEWWPDFLHPVFYAFLAGLVLVGTGAILLPRWPTSWKRRLQSFSRHRVSIPREGIGYLLIMAVLFIGSSLTRSNTLLLVFAAMAGPFVVNGWFTYTMLKHVAIRRQVAARAMVGETFSVELDLENQTSFLSMWMMIAQDQVSVGTETWHPTVLFTRVPPLTVQSGHYQLRLQRRGRHLFGPLQLSSRYPLGLVERGCLYDIPGEVLIYPQIGRLSPHWKRRLTGASELIETPQARSGAFDDEYHHLREFRSGDNPRAIHWRSSARRNELIIREYQQNREHHLLVLVDLCCLVKPGPELDPLVEQTLSFVATLCAEHRRDCRGATLTVVFCGATYWKWEARANSLGLETLLDRLAIAEPATETGFARRLPEMVAGVSSGTRIVVASPRDEHAVMDGKGTSSPHSLHWIRVTSDTFRQLVLFSEPRRRGPASADSETTPVAKRGNAPSTTSAGVRS